MSLIRLINAKIYKMAFRSLKNKKGIYFRLEETKEGLRFNDAKEERMKEKEPHVTAICLLCMLDGLKHRRYIVKLLK
jgi:hypothetical protein